MPVLQAQKPAGEARFKCQTLLDDNAVLSAMACDAHGCASHRGKRGFVNGSPPAALARIGYNADRWQRQVLTVGSGYFRAIGAVDLLIEKAREIEQTWLRGIGVARHLERLTS